MNPVADAAFSSWALDARVIPLLLGVAWVYIRGYRSTHITRPIVFLAGLFVVLLATQSPLDSFDTLFLSAHMTQHVLLMMFAPALILLGHPVVPLLRGLPKTFVKEALGPFLAVRRLRRVFEALVTPPVAWIAFAFSTIFWHLPKFYELALSSPAWHSVQHAAFFWTGILFWWPVIQPGARRSNWPRWTMIPYLLFADFVNTGLSAFFVFSGRVLYPTYETVRASGLSAQNDQMIAGLIMWALGSLLYLIPAFVIATRLVTGGQSRWRTERPLGTGLPRRDSPRPSTTLHTLPLRRLAQTVMLLLALVVMAHGWFGPQVAPVNLAGVLPWIHWRAFSLIALLVVGNLFCMSCPFMLVRDFGRMFFPARWRWPRALRNKWLATVLLVVYLWAYEAFALWDSPWVTAWIIAGYFFAALIVDGFFRGATFCKYVCPIGQFHFVSSLISPREVSIKNEATCRSCRTHDCIRGNSRARGCELNLFQPKKAGNMDCTFCLDCVKACPHENVAILPVAPGKRLISGAHTSSIGRLSRRTDWAFLAIVFTFGAFVNAAGMTGPLMAQEHAWQARLGVHSMPLIVALFVIAGAVAIPALAVLICGALNRVAGFAGRSLDLVRRLIFTLVPLGFAMWAAHLLYHLATTWNRAFPSGITAVQLILLDCGLLLALFTAWRVCAQSAQGIRSALGLLIPWAATALALYCFGAWMLFQPMAMRGVMP